MKKNKSLIATLLFFSLLLVASIGGLSVYADSDDAAADTADTTVSAEDTATPVSGCDLKAEDLVKVEVKQYGFSMLVPNGNVTSLDSPTENFTAVGYSRPYFIEQGCAMQVYTDNDNYCAVSVFVEDLSSLYDYYGDYNSLSPEQQDELVKDALDEGNETAEFVKINGRTYLQSYVSDSSEDSADVYAQYQFTTVIDGIKYMIYIQTANAVEADRAVINEMIKSIKLNGMGLQLNAVDITMIVVVVLLVLAVALAYFFLYRVSEFTKAGVEKFAIIGFDMPHTRYKNDYDDDDDDEDDDEDDDYEEDEADSVEEDDEDSDDERIIKH